MSAGERDQGLRALEERLRHRFRDPALLERALTHSSAAHEDLAGEMLHNEPLEFLGDAVIALVTADFLHRRDPDGPEGRKSKLKAHLVSAGTLAERAEALGLPALLRLGKGEEKTGGRTKRALAADAYEAVVAALYLDGGLEAAARVLTAALETELAGERRLSVRDPKSTLQERLQARSLPLPDYVIVGEEGPAHQRLFRVQCLVCGEALGEGEGASKQAAEQLAASAALDALRARESTR